MPRSVQLDIINPTGSSELVGLYSASERTGSSLRTDFRLTDEALCVGVSLTVICFQAGRSILRLPILQMSDRPAVLKAVSVQILPGHRCTFRGFPPPYSWALLLSAPPPETVIVGLWDFPTIKLSIPELPDCWLKRHWR